MTIIARRLAVRGRVRYLCDTIHDWGGNISLIFFMHHQKIPLMIAEDLIDGNTHIRFIDDFYFPRRVESSELTSKKVENPIVFGLVGLSFELACIKIG